MTLFYDLINLNNPKYDIHDHLIKVKVPHEQALKTYLETPASIISTGPGSNYVTLQGGIRFINPVKAIHFQKDAFTTFYKTNIKVERDTRDPLHVEVYRTQKPHPFSIQINGALLITGETNLSHLLGVAKEIGTTLASIEIKGLISSSTFFRQALAHDELSGKIKEIQERKARSEAERNPSLYPLWEYFKDIEDLKQKAQKLGIDSSYVDNLLKDEALRPHSGHLLWYYSSLKQFTMQWAIINLSVLICLILLKHYVPNLIKIAPVESPKILILMIIISINGFIIYERPKALDIIYWIIPGLLFIFCALLILFSYWAQAE
jgi:hypothetical protein